MDTTQNYRSAFYSCAAGMILGSVFLAFVRPCKTGLCQNRKLNLEENTSEAPVNLPDDFIETDIGKVDDSGKGSESMA